MMFFASWSLHDTSTSPVNMIAKDNPQHDSTTNGSSNLLFWWCCTFLQGRRRSGLCPLLFQFLGTGKDKHHLVVDHKNSPQVSRQERCRRGFNESMVISGFWLATMQCQFISPFLILFHLPSDQSDHFLPSISITFQTDITCTSWLSFGILGISTSARGSSGFAGFSSSKFCRQKNSHNHKT